MLVKDRWLRRLPPYGDLDPKFPATWVDGRTCASKYWGFCYVRIPKCANSTVLRTLIEHDERMLKPLGEYDSLKAKSEAYSRLSSLSLRRAVLLRRINYFSVVRDPMSRLVSAYREKILEGKAQKYRVASFYGIQADENICFERFLAYLEAGGLYEDPHWLPQSEFLTGVMKENLMLGKVESLEDDLRYIVHVLFGESPWRGVKSWIPHKGNEKKFSVGDLSVNQKSRVRAMYERDYELLESAYFV
ncbi:Sulfotransferase family protein [Aquisalimonas asiatica]|uniref:Sulfotransferase family protein n=1 Tax=Aquisalimonas asiatica TaxID=406100 RepID=A0A1H8SPE2_9GAMM|nr:Sulfotransferase family protein [Aquisalimonas asiatica]